MKYRRIFIQLLLVFIANATWTVGQDEFSTETEGYLEPLQKIDVSSVETGTIDSIQVKEGDNVSRGQILARLNRDVLLKSKKVAEFEAKAVGNLKIAKAELAVQLGRLKILQGLAKKGHARRSELERALGDVEVAKGRVLQAEEAIAVRKRELEQIHARIEARNVKSPIDGIVVEIHKKPGEAVSPGSPVVVTVIDISKLRCVLNVPRHRARSIQVDQPVGLETDARQKITGKVQWKSPIVDAESETVKVIVLVDNQNGEFTGGDHCILRDDRDVAQSRGPGIGKAVSFPDSAND